jgi:hypothetical protein
MPGGRIELGVELLVLVQTDALSDSPTRTPARWLRRLLLTEVSNMVDYSEPYSLS